MCIFVYFCVKLYIFTSYFKQSVKVYFELLLRFLRDFYAFWVTFTLFEGLLRFLSDFYAFWVTFTLFEGLLRFFKFKSVKVTSTIKNMSKLLSYHQKNMFNRSKKTKMLPSNDTLTVNHVIIIFLGIKRLGGITHLIFN